MHQCILLPPTGSGKRRKGIYAHKSDTYLPIPSTTHEQPNATLDTSLTYGEIQGAKKFLPPVS